MFVSEIRDDIKVNFYNAVYALINKSQYLK